jgi:ABC-type glycerol-3-phosphate transport system substrate-binding protein
MKKRKISRSLKEKASKFVKVFGVSVLAVSMALTLTGCSQKKTVATPKQLVVWGFVDEDVIKPLITSFSKKNNLEVKYYKKDLNSSYETDALNSILSGQGPDVWAMPNDWVYRHKEMLASMPADQIKTRKLVMKDAFAEPILKDNVFDNNIYGLSPTIDVLHIFYNPTLYDAAFTNFKKNYNGADKEEISSIFRKFPVTWGEFNRIVPFLTSKNGSTIETSAVAMGTSNNVANSSDILSLLMLQNQTKMVADSLDLATFNLPIKNSAGADVFPGKNALDFYTSYSDPNSANYTWNGGMPNDIDAFVQGKVTMIFAYSTLGNRIQQQYPKFTISKALVPQIGDLNPITDYTKYTTYTVPESSPLVTKAWDFVAQLSIDEASSYKSATKELPSKKSSEEVPLAKRSSNSAPTSSEITTASTWNKGRYPVELDNLFKDAINRVVNRSQNSQAALDTSAASATELLRRTTW